MADQNGQYEGGDFNGPYDIPETDLYTSALPIAYRTRDKRQPRVQPRQNQPSAKVVGCKEAQKGKPPKTQTASPALDETDLFFWRRIQRSPTPAADKAVRMQVTPDVLAAAEYNRLKNEVPVLGGKSPVLGIERTKASPEVPPIVPTPGLTVPAGNAAQNSDIGTSADDGQYQNMWDLPFTGEDKPTRVTKYRKPEDPKKALKNAEIQAPKTPEEQSPPVQRGHRTATNVAKTRAEAAATQGDPYLDLTKDRGFGEGGAKTPIKLQNKKHKHTHKVEHAVTAEPKCTTPSLNAQSPPTEPVEEVRQHGPAPGATVDRRAQQGKQTPEEKSESGTAPRRQLRRYPPRERSKKGTKGDCDNVCGENRRNYGGEFFGTGRELFRQAPKQTYYAEYGENDNENYN